MSLENVVKALKRLAGKDEPQGNISPSSDESEHLECFCAEDTLLTNDLNVSVTGIGTLPFPLTSDMVENIIQISSKAKFGKGEATLLDTTVRDTQMVPANMLKVGINEESLNDILKRIGAGLNIDEDSCLVPHLYNMLIYGPGQFFKMHRDSEKIKNMVATLVLLLPSPHKGGDLIICQKNSKHVFFGSQKRSVVKCIAFYSDCQHEIEKVTEGYRVALTYNVVLQSPGFARNALIDKDLNTAVQLYFSSEDSPERLVFYLNHSYSEKSLKWNLLKGTDRTYALSLLAVAKKQGRVPCLALAEYREQCELGNPYSSYSPDPYDSGTELVFWVDELSLQFNESTEISEEELCYTTETTDLFEPYNVEEEEATGNEAGYKESWYRRACVVLWSSKWGFEHGFKNTLHDLNQLTSEKGNEELIIDEINNAGDRLFNRNFWNDPMVINSLMNIAAYVKNKEKAIAILTKLGTEVVNPCRFSYILVLEQVYGKEILATIIQPLNETKKGGWNVEKSLAIIEKFLEQINKKPDSLFVKMLLKKTVKEFLKKNKKNCNLKVTTLNTMYRIFQICTNLQHPFLENEVIYYILEHPAVYPLQLANVLSQIQSMIPQNEVHKYRNFTNSSLKLLDELTLTLQLTEDDTNWTWPFNLPCKCQHCKKLLSFLHSPDKTVVFECSEQDKSHVDSILKYLKDQPVKQSKQRTQVVIEKEPELLDVRKKLLENLAVIKEKLKKWTSKPQETVRSEFTSNQDISLSESLGNQLSSGESVNKRKKIE